MSMRRVVITGMGVVSPLGNSVGTFWQGLCEGRSGIRRVETFPVDDFPSQIAGEAPPVQPEGFGAKEMRRYSRAIVFAVAAADEAMKQAGVDMDKEDPYRCGVIVGSGFGGTEVIYENAVKLDKAGPRRVSPLLVPSGIINMIPGVLAIRYHFQGMNKSVVTACATGTQCIGDAVMWIRQNKADVMLAGASEACVTPLGLAGFGAMHALSTRNDEPEKASRPFDRDRDGFVLAEGAGILVLESEEHARARGAEILAEVVGVGETCDAHHITAPAPDAQPVAQAMRLALQEAGLSPSAIDYYNAHGTSTRLNDPIETLALKQVFGDSMPPVSSTKSMTGHLLGAAGAIEAIACVMAVRDGILPPNINYENPDPECAVNIVANVAREASVATAMSNSLGFGGHNASIILRRYEP